MQPYGPHNSAQGAFPLLTVCPFLVAPKDPPNDSHSSLPPSDKHNDANDKHAPMPPKEAPYKGKPPKPAPYPA